MKKLGFIFIIGLGLGYLIGFKVFSPKTIVEAPAAEIRQKDGSLVLQRDPNAKIKPITLPNGSELIRQASVTIKPSERFIEGLKHDLGPIPTMTVDISLVRLNDGTHRVIAKSQDGDIVGGIDIPIEKASVPKDYKWVAGGIVLKNGYGLFVQRNWGSLMVGLDVMQTQHLSNKSMDYAFRAGIRF